MVESLRGFQDQRTASGVDEMASVAVSSRFGGLTGLGSEGALVADAKIADSRVGGGNASSDPSAFKGVELAPGGVRLLQTFREFVEGGKPEAHFDLAERRNAQTGKYELIMITADPAGRKFPVMLIEGNRSAPARMEEFGYGQPLLQKMRVAFNALNATDNRLPRGQSGGFNVGNAWDAVVGAGTSLVNVVTALPEAVEKLGRLGGTLPRQLQATGEALFGDITGNKPDPLGPSNLILTERRTQFGKSGWVSDRVGEAKVGIANALGANPGTLAFTIGDVIGPILIAGKAGGGKSPGAPGGALPRGLDPSKVATINANIAKAPLSQVVDTVKRMTPEFIARMKSHPDTVGTFQALQSRLQGAAGSNQPGAAQALQKLLAGSGGGSPGVLAPVSNGGYLPRPQQYTPPPGLPGSNRGQPPQTRAQPPGEITPVPTQQPAPTIVRSWEYTPVHPTTGARAANKVGLHQDNYGRFYAKIGDRDVPLSATNKPDAERELNAMVKAPSQVWKYTPPSGEQMQIFRNPDKSLSVQRGDGQVIPLGTSNLKDAQNKLNTAFPKPTVTSPPKPVNTAPVRIADYTPGGSDEKLVLFRQPNNNLLAQRPNGQVIDLKTTSLDTAKTHLNSMVEKGPTEIWKYTPKGNQTPVAIFRGTDGMLNAQAGNRTIQLGTSNLNEARAKIDDIFPPSAKPTQKTTERRIETPNGDSFAIRKPGTNPNSPAQAPRGDRPGIAGDNSGLKLSPNPTINPNPPDEPTVFQLSTPTVPITPPPGGTPGQINPNQKLLPETSSANVPRTEVPGAAGQPIQVTTGKFDLTNPANTATEGQSITGTGPAPTSGFNPMLTVGKEVPTQGPTQFDSMGQVRTLTSGSFDKLPSSVQDQFAELLKAGNAPVYGAKPITQIKEILGESTIAAASVLDQPVSIAAGTQLKTFVVVPAGTVIPEGTVFPKDMSFGGPTLAANDALPIAITLDKASVLPVGTKLSNGLTLPTGTVAGAATLTDKMGSTDGALEAVRYLGQVVANPLLPGGGGQAFTGLVNQSLQEGKVVVAVTIDPNNFFNAFSGKPGAYGKTPLPSFGMSWVHQEGAGGVTQADRRFFNFNTSDPSANQISSPGGRSIFAGEQQITPDWVLQAGKDLGFNVDKGGRRILFGWVPEGKKVPDFVWQDDTSRGLGGTNGQPVGNTWNYWLPVNPGPLDPSKLPANPNLPKAPTDNFPSPFTPATVPQSTAPTSPYPLAINPPANTTQPAPIGTDMVPTGQYTPPPAPLTPGTITPQSPFPQEAISNIQSSIGAPTVFPVNTPSPEEINAFGRADTMLLEQAMDVVKASRFWDPVGLLWDGSAALATNAGSAVGNAFMNNIATPLANTPVGSAMVQYGQTGGEKLGQVVSYLNNTPPGKALNFVVGQTIGSPSFQAGLAKFGAAAGGTTRATVNTTIGLLALGASNGTLQITSFRVSDTNLTPVQKEIARRTSLPKNAVITAAYAPIPGAEGVNGRAILWKAELPNLILPPGLPGQPGTAQTTAGLTPSGRVLIAPSAVAGGPTVLGGAMLGTPNLSINYTNGLSAGSIGLNPFLARVGQTVTVSPENALKFSNPADAGIALSVAPYRFSQILSVNVGPGQVRLARLVDPVMLTTDATTGGLVLQPGTRVTSFLSPQFATNGAADMNAADAQAARDALSALINMGKSQPTNQLPPGAKP